MVYTCGDCRYETSRKVNFVRHRNRKNPCHNTITGVKIDNLVEKRDLQKGHDDLQKGHDSFCSKCNKELSSKYALKRHFLVCTGVNRLTCPTCFKCFSSVSSKNNHLRTVKCKAPPPPEPSPLQSSALNQVINNTVTTTNCNNNTNIQNNNIHINAFGSEDMGYLINDPGIIERLKQYGKAGIYGLPKILDEVHFKRPENGSIIKPDQFGNTVLIKNEDNEWEIREFEDVREDMIETIIKYVRMYNDTKNKLGITLSEKKERSIIKNIGYELMALDGSIPRDLFHELEMDEDNVEEDENEIKKKTRKFDKSTMHNIHVRTYNGYKKEGSDYVKR